MFIAFKNKEDAEKFLNDPEKAKFRDKDVIRKFKYDYLIIICKYCMQISKSLCLLMKSCYFFLIRNDYFDEKKKVRETRKAEAKASTMYGYS